MQTVKKEELPLDKQALLALLRRDGYVSGAEQGQAVVSVDPDDRRDPGGNLQGRDHAETGRLQH